MSTPPELFTARVKKVRNSENEAAFMQQAAHRSERSFRYISHSLFILVCITVLHKFLFPDLLQTQTKLQSITNKIPMKMISFFNTVSFVYTSFHKIVGRNNKICHKSKHFLCNNQLTIKFGWKPSTSDLTYIYVCKYIPGILIYIQTFDLRIQVFHDKMKTCNEL